MGGIVSSSGEEKRSSSVGMSPTTSIFSASAIYMQHKLSQSGWRRIGKETGWLKEAGNKLGDLIEAKIGLEDADFYIVPFTGKTNEERVKEVLRPTAHAKRPNRT